MKETENDREYSGSCCAAAGVNHGKMWYLCYQLAPSSDDLFTGTLSQATFVFKHVARMVIKWVIIIISLSVWNWLDCWRTAVTWREWWNSVLSERVQCLVVTQYPLSVSMEWSDGLHASTFDNDHRCTWSYRNVGRDRGRVWWAYHDQWSLIHSLAGLSRVGLGVFMYVYHSCSVYTVSACSSRQSVLQCWIV